MFMDRKLIMALGVLATATLGAASSASAADSGYVTSNLNLRAGPGLDYPAVIKMRAGDGVTIYGCLSGWTWCDIDWRGNRGWAAGRYLQVMYQSHRRPITSYGTYIGLPFITFSVDSYWNDHYHNRGFYNQRSRFDHNNGGKPGGQYPSNGNPPSNEPMHHYKSNTTPNVGNAPDNNNPPPSKGGKKVKPFDQGGNTPQGGNAPTGNGPKAGNGSQGGGKPAEGPGCPPGQKMINGACQ